ncbi:MAG: hypothetical protein HC918_04855 [Oscillatoriales cyanobacterium SM2_1_8]|nr:hypothetical protein [Oscillatoriales cyanobacterium SM2_1_8]
MSKGPTLQEATLRAVCEVWNPDPEAIAFVVRQRDRLPDWLRLGVAMWLWGVALSGWGQGRWFHDLPLDARRQILCRWQQEWVPGHDLVRLWQSLALFGNEP